MVISVRHYANTTECNTPINRAPARAARWTNRCRGGIAASMQKPPVRARRISAQTGGFPTAASYAEIRRVRHMLPRSHPAGNLPQAASGIESPAVDACGRRDVLEDLVFGPGRGGRALVVDEPGEQPAAPALHLRVHAAPRRRGADHRVRLEMAEPLPGSDRLGPVRDWI